MGTTVCKTSDIPLNQSKAFQIDGEKVLVFHLDDGFYATQAKCTHLFMSLEKGKVLEGCNVQCPFHRAQFDIRTGEVSKWANFPPGIQLLNAVRKEKALKTFPVSVVEDDVIVG